MKTSLSHESYCSVLLRYLCILTSLSLIPVVGVEDDRSDIGSVLVEWKWDMMVRSTFVCSNKACTIGDPRFSASAISIGSRGSSSSKVCSGLKGVAGATEGRAILWDRRGLRHLVNVVISYLSFG